MRTLFSQLSPVSPSRLGYACLIISLLLLPILFPQPYLIRMAVLVFIYAILAMSLNLLLGFTGIISLGHAAFYGIGAYTTGVLSTKFDLPFLLNFPASMIASALVALIFGIIVLRSLKFLYFALASWGLGEILIAIYMNVDYLGGVVGIRAIPEPAILGFVLSSDIYFYYLGLFLVVLSLISIEVLVVSRVGRAWEAVRENETVAGVIGINVYTYQVLAFVIASVYAGAAGSLYAYYERYISPHSFSIWESIIIVCMVLLGGKRSLIGSVVGAGILVLLPEILRGVGELRMLIYGFILLFTILFKPKGLVPPYYFSNNKLKRRPAVGDPRNQ